MRTSIISLSLILLFPFFSNAADHKESSKAIKFIENKGQVHDQFFEPRPDVLFYGESNNLNYFLRRNGLSYQLHSVAKTTSDGNNLSEVIDFYRIDLQFIEPNQDLTITPMGINDEFLNYYTTNCESGVTDVMSYRNLMFNDVFEGIDLHYYNKNGQLEYDFIVDPNQSCETIRWTVNGATDLFVDEEGRLNIETPLGTIIEDKPIAFQGNQTVEVSWRVNGNEVSFDVGDYNTALPLTIDPVVRVWGTYMGGSLSDVCQGMTIDFVNLYTTGSSLSTSTIATTGAHQTSLGSSTLFDAVLTKWDLDGNRVWSTYYGGSDEDIALNVTTDDASNVYITGQTESPNAIATAGTFQTTFTGPLRDMFVAKFNSNGVRQWGTYYGGPARDAGVDVRTDSVGNVFVAGRSSSGALASTGSFQSTIGGNEDAMLIKLDSNGNRLWATYFGGSANESCFAMDVDDNQNVVIIGNTSSSSGVASAGAHQNTYAGSADGYVAKFDQNGNRLWSTYFGGTSAELGYDVEVDVDQNIIFTGYTSSTTGISTAGAQQTSFAGSLDIFLVKFDQSGNRIWGTYYGGSGADFGFTVTSDDQANIFLGARTNSMSNFATTGVYKDTLGGVTDGGVIKFDSAGQRIWATYYGDSQNFETRGIEVDPFSQIYIGGTTSGALGYATPGAYQSTNGGLNDMVLAKFSECNNGSYVELNGCDSVFNPNSLQVWTQSGLFRDTLMNAGSCDSIVLYQVDVRNSDFSSISDTACSTYVSPTGRILTTTGLYSDTLSNILGCDSIIDIDLLIPVLDTTISANGTVINSNATGVAYQWIDCSTNMPIAGATGQSYTASTNGDYAVIVSAFDCNDTSDCYTINTIGIAEDSDIYGIKVIPNPNNGEFTIQSERILIGKVQLLNTVGQVVFDTEFNEQSRSIHLPERIESGIYLLKFVSVTGRFVQQIVIER